MVSELSANLLKWTLDYTLPARSPPDTNDLNLTIFTALFMFCTIEVIVVKIMTAFIGDYGNSQSMLDEYYFGDQRFEHNHHERVSLFTQE